jgi:transcription-repair coupling factor (superfamily II helicase)
MKAQLVAANYKSGEPGAAKPGQPGEAGQALAAESEPGQAQDAALVPRRGVARKRTTLKVDEKVLVAPLVTLDLPLDAYLPASYVPDERVRLSVYQRMAEAQTPAAVRELRADLQDRFGDLPEAAECLLQWLLIKAMALQAGVTSIVTTDEEFIVRLPEGNFPEREKLRRRYGRDPVVKIGPHFVRLDRRALNRSSSEEWLAALTGVLETLARAA